MGRELEGRFGREGIWVYLWLILVDVWQKTTKFCKAVIQKVAQKKKKKSDIQYDCIQYDSIYSDSEIAQLCPTLCDPMDSSPPGSSVHGIFQARILEWVALSFSIYKTFWKRQNYRDQIRSVVARGWGVKWLIIKEYIQGTFWVMEIFYNLIIAMVTYMLLLLLLSRFSHVRLCATP